MLRVRSASGLSAHVRTDQQSRGTHSRHAEMEYATQDSRYTMSVGCRLDRLMRNTISSSGTRTWPPSAIRTKYAICFAVLDR